MRLLHIFPKPGERLADQRAGDAVRALALTSALAANNVEILRAEGASDGSAATAARTYKSIVRNAVPKKIAFAVRDILRVMLTRKLGRQVARRFEGAGIDAVIETHDPLSLAGAEAAKRLNVPLILDDASPVLEAATMAGIGLVAVHEKTFRTVTSQADLIVTVNATMKNQLVASGVPETKLAVIENGVDMALFGCTAAARPSDVQVGAGGQHRGVGQHERNVQNGGADRPTTFVFVGSFQAYHRTSFLIEAFARGAQKSSLLIMVGDGREMELCKATARRLGLADRVEFFGRVSNDQVPMILAGADVAVLPATNAYGNPMKLYEYLAAGLAVIAPDQETVRQVVHDGEGVLLFQPDCGAGLASAIRSLNEDCVLRATMGAASRRVAGQHTWNRRAQKLETLIDGILKARRLPDEAWLRPAEGHQQLHDARSPLSHPRLGNSACPRQQPSEV